MFLFVGFYCTARKQIGRKRLTSEPVAYPRGEWGTPHFSKSWSSRFAQKFNKIDGGGIDRSGISVKKWSLRFLKRKERMVFSRIGSKVLVSKKCLNTAGRGILSQSRMHIFKNVPDVLPSDPVISISLVISA